MRRFSSAVPTLSLAFLMTLPAMAQKAPEADAAPARSRLADEKSPYLRQHADNPVDWWPWSEAAFEAAKKENKPVFLSIGYSTCHWCHVMEHESFEDEATAAYLKKHFICIKVDREERPDVDRIYMNYQQAVHGSGGWPLSVWLTPDRVPFISGTYFPKDAKPGQLSFMAMLNRIQQAWSEHSDGITEDSQRILDRMEDFFASTPSEDDRRALETPLADQGFQQLAATFDAEFGGFGGAPKFPQPANLRFLLEHRLTLDPGDEKGAHSLEMVEATLRKMARGGINDHLGGGFHRYSVDQFWHVPHFEKMLYDQAQISTAYLDAFQITGNPEYEAVARSIFGYVDRLLSHPGGGFYSAEDADSLDPTGVHEHKTEGAFYLWSAAGVVSLLGEEKAAVFNAAYDVRPGGNAPEGSDPFNEFTGRNILYRVKSTAELAEAHGKTPDEIDALLEESRATLLAERATRPRPHLDDKILTAWNALMISAYARAYEVLGDEAFLQRATAAAGFLRDNLYVKDTRTLLRSWREGPSSILGTADDYAYFIAALLDLHQATHDGAWLELALELQENQITLLEDTGNGGFFDAPATQTDLILRLKNTQDGARPSANAVSALNLLRLSAILKSGDFDASLDRLFNGFARELATSPLGHITLLTAWQRQQESPAQVVVAGSAEDGATTAILEKIRAKFYPNKVVILLDEGPGRAFLDRRNPLFAEFKPIDGRPTLYLCRNYTCQKPVNDPKEIAAQLEKL